MVELKSNIHVSRLSFFHIFKVSFIALMINPRA